MTSNPSSPPSSPPKSELPKSWSAERSLRDVAWVAKFLGVSRSWVYQASANGVLPTIRLGSLLRFDAKVIDAWARGGGVAAASKNVKLPSCR